MLIIIGLALIFGIFFGFINEWEGDGSGLGAALFAAFIGLFIAFTLPADMETSVSSQNLETLQDGMGLQGSFFLGSGQIDGKMQYVYYYQKDSVSYKMGQVPYYDVTIRYSDERPRIETHTLSMKPIKTAKRNLFCIDQSSTTYVIYVPKGTIRQNFNLDAQ